MNLDGRNFLYSKIERMLRRKMRILTILPVYGIPPELNVESYLEHKKDAETQIIYRGVKKGTAIIASRSDELIAGYHIIKEALKATKEGNFDAVFVDCFGDPGVDELRELLNVPVLGAFQACVHVASMLGRRFSIVTVNHYGAESLKDLAVHYGLSHKLSSVRYLDMTPLELGKRLKEPYIRQEFVKIARRAIKEDGADVILPGCCYFSEIVDDVREDVDAVIVDPLEVPIRIIESLVKMKLKHSKRVFPTIPKKHLKQYRL